jgi:hypothetical protein
MVQRTQRPRRHQTADFQLTLSAPVWTLTPDEYRASREASGREHLAWMEQTFGPLTGEVREVNLGELLAEQQRDEESEEWKRADDDGEPDANPPR